MSSNAGPDIVQDGLVFKYDTGDGKSYKGEPTTNVVSQPFNLSSGYSKGTGMETASGTTLNFTGGYNASTITRPSTDVSNWIAYTGAVEGEASGVQFTTTWYLKAGSISSVYVSWGGAHTGNKTNLTVNLNTGAVTGVTLASGEFYRVRAEENGYYAIEYSSTLTGTNYYPQLTLNSAGFIYFGGIQIEQKPHATPFVNGTRSATQGLLDRTGNSTIDISNASFDSNAQMTFDGTDDYISIPTYTFGNGNWTLNMWINVSAFANYNLMSNSSSGPVSNIFGAYGSNTKIFYMNYDGSWQDHYGNTTLSTNNWYMLTWVNYEGASASAGTMKMYVNGVADSDVFNSYTTNGGPCNVIGKRWSGTSFNGKISQVSINTRSLTDAEVLQNFNATKSRFGL